MPIAVKARVVREEDHPVLEDADKRQQERVGKENGEQGHQWTAAEMLRSPLGENHPGRQCISDEQYIGLNCKP